MPPLAGYSLMYSVLQSSIKMDRTVDTYLNSLLVSRDDESIRSASQLASKVQCNVRWADWTQLIHTTHHFASGLCMERVVSCPITLRSCDSLRPNDRLLSQCFDLREIWERRKNEDGEKKQKKGVKHMNPEYIYTKRGDGGDISCPKTLPHLLPSLSPLFQCCLPK